MNKKMNIRSGLCAIAILALMGCGESKEREQQYLEKAKAYVLQKNQDKARVELKNVLQINPKNTEARYLMAELAEQDQDWQKMYELLSALIEDKPDFIEAQIKLGSLFFLSGDLQKATEKIEYVLAKEPDNSQALTLQAAVALHKNDNLAAETLLQKALTLKPNNLDATYLLAKVYGNTKAYDKALKVIDDALRQHPEEVNLALMKVQVLTSLNKQSEAETIVLNLVKQFPDNSPLHYSVAKYYVTTQKLDKAEQTLKDLITKKATETEPKLALIQFYLSQKNETKAEQSLLEFIQQNPGNFDLAFALAELYKNKPENAIKVLNQIIGTDGRGPNGLKAKLILAMYAQQRGDTKQTQQLVEQVIADDSHNAEALMLHSSLMLEQDKYDDAIADLRTVLRDQPNSEKALILSAKTHLKSGYIDLAQESLENVLAINPANIDVRKDLARMLVQKKDPERAVSLLESLGQAKQSNAEVVSMLVDLYIMNKNWNKAEETAKSINTSTDKGLAQFKLAQVYVAQKKYPLALTAYQDVLKLKPLNIEALAGMTETYLAMGESVKAGSELDKLLGSNPDNVELLNLRGFLYRSQKQLPQAEQMFTKVLKLKKNADFAYRNVASVLIMQNQIENALSLYQKGLNELPGNINLLLGLAELYEKTGKDQQTIETYTQILKIAPSNSIAANNLASMIASTTEDPKRLSEAYALVKPFKDSKEPPLLDTYGWLSFLNGQVDDAARALEKVIEMNPNYVEFNYHLGMVYAAKSRNEEAKMLLEKAIASHVEFPGKAKATAKLAELGGA